MLRESISNRDELIVESITSDDGLGTGVEHGDIIVKLVNATLANDDTLPTVRQTVVDTFGQAGLVDMAGVIGTFTMQTRIADVTGLPFDAPFEMGTRKLRQQLGADDFQFLRAFNCPALHALSCARRVIFFA